LVFPAEIVNPILNNSTVFARFPLRCPELYPSAGSIYPFSLALVNPGVLLACNPIQSLRDAALDARFPNTDQREETSMASKKTPKTLKKGKKISNTKSPVTFNFTKIS
jgi:hypothetical protein